VKVPWDDKLVTTEFLISESILAFEDREAMYSQLSELQKLDPSPTDLTELGQQYKRGPLHGPNPWT
jgi:hypothetical protein